MDHRFYHKSCFLREGCQFSRFDITINLEFNVDIISNKLEWSSVSNLRKLLRFTKGLYRLGTSSTGRFSFPQEWIETL